MKKLVILLCIVAVAIACNQASSASEKETVRKDYPVGLYKVQIGMENLISKEKLDTADAATKLMLSFASLLEVRINFQENGYLKFEGDFGFLSFPTKTQQNDSVKYYIEGNQLILDDKDVDIKINDNEPIYIFPMEDGFKMVVDSLELNLEEIR